MEKLHNTPISPCKCAGSSSREKSFIFLARLLTTAAGEREALASCCQSQKMSTSRWILTGRLKNWSARLCGDEYPGHYLDCFLTSCQATAFLFMYSCIVVLQQQLVSYSTISSTAAWSMLPCQPGQRIELNGALYISSISAFNCIPLMSQDIYLCMFLVSMQLRTGYGSLPLYIWGNFKLSHNVVAVHLHRQFVTDARLFSLGSVHCQLHYIHTQCNCN